MTVKINLPKSFNSDKNKTYKVGDTFYNKKYGVVMLIAIKAFTVSFITLNDGLRYNDEGVSVENLWVITEKEFAEICDGEQFIPVDLEINVIVK